jgi:transcriptional regulator with XRE-family HTH domain
MADIYMTEPFTSSGSIVDFAKSPCMATLGEQLRQLRVAAGLRQIDLVRAGVAGQSTVSETENDTRPTTTDVIERWLSVCGGSLTISAPGRAEALDQLSDEERAMVEAARRIPEAERQLVVDVIRAWPRLDPFQRSVFALAARDEAAARSPVDSEK